MSTTVMPSRNEIAARIDRYLAPRGVSVLTADQRELLIIAVLAGDLKLVEVTDQKGHPVTHIVQKDKIWP